jgi:hypothetical protein
VKAKKLLFEVRYAELEPPAGMTRAWFLKRVLIDVTGLDAQRSASEARTLWRIYDELEAEPDTPEFTLSLQDYEVLRKRWEACFPKATGVGYKWLKSIDEILDSAAEVELKEAE